MADDHKDAGGSSFLEEAGLLIGVFLLLLALWVMRGKPNSADIRKGLFVAPPSPIGNGQVFGPTLGATSTPTVTSPTTNPTNAPLSTTTQPNY